jgi:hypothetical protein
MGESMMADGEMCVLSLRGFSVISEDDASSFAACPKILTNFFLLHASLNDAFVQVGRCWAGISFV